MDNLTGFALGRCEHPGTLFFGYKNPATVLVGKNIEFHNNALEGTLALESMRAATHVALQTA